MAFGYLYRISAPTGMSYIGITRKEPTKRFREHAKSKRGTALSDAFKVHGEAGMAFSVLAIVEARELAATEQRAIAAYDTLWPNGLNATPGGNGVVRSIASAEVLRIKKMRATMSTRAYKNLQRDIQAGVWTEEKRSERAETMRGMWKDEAYRTKMLATRRRKRQVQYRLDLAASHSDVVKKLWADPERRARLLASQALVKASPEWRANASAKTRLHMEKPANRLRIATAMSKYSGVQFEKAVVAPAARKPSRITRAWASLPDVFTFADVFPHDWQGREIDRALERGWIKILG